MNKKLSSLIALVVLFLLTIVVPAQAGPPENAAGLWQYIPTVTDVKVANGNTFLDTTDVGQWFGVFEGISTEVGRVIQHSSGSMVAKIEVTFTGVVDGKAGTLDILVLARLPDMLPSTEWEGTWVIRGGTGDLASLHGKGTIWGPGWNPAEPEEWGDIYYAGNVHFDP